MHVFDAMMSRRSIRKFAATPVDDKLIGVALFMASQAPSAGNVQEWEFIVVKDEDQKKRIAKCALNQKFIAQAPVVVVFCANLTKSSLKFGKRGETLYAIQDTAMAIQNFMLSAYSMGLGTCFVGSFEEDLLSTALELPDTVRPIAILPVGYPAEEEQSPGRIPFENLSHIDKYGRKTKLANWQLEAKMGEGVIEPLSVYLEAAFRNLVKERKKQETKEKKPTSFEEFLKMMAK